MKTNITNKLLEGTPLKAEDAARLILEATERLGESIGKLTRIELLQKLRRVVEAGIAAVEKEEETVSFQEAAWASIEARSQRRPTTRRDLRYFVRRILKYSDLGTRPLRAITRKECTEALNGGFKNSMHAMRKARAILHSIFAYGIHQEWCDTNPVSLIPSPSVEEKEIQALDLKSIQQLKETVDKKDCQDMKLSLHLMLYCGIRPAEVQRLRTSDFNLEEKTVLIRPQTSKTGGCRVVPLRCCAKLLSRTIGENPIPRNWARRWKQLRRAAGFEQWTPDVLRHTFASYHAKYFRNLAELQLEMGHRDTQLLRTRYLNMRGISHASARRFWTEG